jgi:DNA-binding transcriptional ArsR family regulator
MVSMGFPAGLQKAAMVTAPRARFKGRSLAMNNNSIYEQIFDYFDGSRIVSSRKTDNKIELLSEAAAMFRLMGDATRLGILRAMCDGPMSVSALALAVSASSSLVSHHLRLLRSARIVRADRQGRHVFYALADEHIRCVLDDMLVHAGEQHIRSVRSRRRKVA